MIVLKDITKMYEIGANRVLASDNVNLTIEKGDFLALMGPSGSGKSTLLYAIGGLLTPTKGELIANGTSIYRLNSRERAMFRRENVGFIFQTFELLPHLTALENVMLPLYLARVPSVEQEDRAREALDQVGLRKRGDHKPTELSGGEQQRVAIARGIVNNPTILLADEPTGNLDQKTGTEIMGILSNLHEHYGLTMIVVTHDPKVSESANRIVHMVDGHIVAHQNKIDGR